MSKIIEDFRKFSIDKTGVSPMAFDDVVKKTENSIMPFILEERKMNVTQLDVFSRLMYDRIIFLSGEVTPEYMDTITAQILYLDSVENRDISIYLNTPGGDCYSGLQLVSVMDFVKSSVSTTVLGMAASMGAVIASNGEKGKRFALPYSRFMIHQPSSYNGYSKFTDSKIALQEMESVRNDLYEVLAKNSGKPIDEIIQLCENGDKWYRGQDMIEAGFIDKIIVGTK